MAKTEVKKDWFTLQEILEIKSALKGISGLGVNIGSYSTSNEQMKAFFDKAKVWRVIKTIIQTLYIKRLADGKMFLTDTDGNEYRVVRRDEV